MNTEFARTFFPGLDSPWIFMDNAGGSQIASTVTDRMMEFYHSSNVQLGASYQPSTIATQRVMEGESSMAEYIHAKDPSEVIMGGSSSLLLRILAWNLGNYFPVGSEIIVTDCDHEANIGCWRELESKGMIIKTWKLNPETLTLDLDTLEALLTRQTRLVAFTHVSNILGTINPVKEITGLVHRHGALVCVDGVAYAPHGQIDVLDWDVDFYVFSFYKTFGPHYAMLYGKQSILINLPGNNHYFIGKKNSPYKFQPGRINFEIGYGMCGLTDYLGAIYTEHFPGVPTANQQEKFSKVFGLIREHEYRLSNRVLSFLQTKPAVRIIGQPTATITRVPTISFVVKDTDSESIVLKTDKHQIGIRYGDFYARRLIEKLNLDPHQGVVRISMVHYNTMEEVDKLIQALDQIF